jgi:eukaryotic-like serine/threonine-protein kinase
MPSNSYKYKAFISYSHQDKKWGDWLHKKLETYRVSKGLIGKQTGVGVVPKRLFPIFRDREELPTSSKLGEVIAQALQESSHLVIICSPRSAKSQWVNEEIKYFKRLGKAERILCLIVDGEPYGADKTDLGSE